MKLFYTTNNAYCSVIAVYPDHAEWFTMDGSEDLPVINSRYLDDHPEYDSEKGKYGTHGGQSYTDRPALEKAAEDYLRRIAYNISDWSWYDTEATVEPGEDEDEFLVRIIGEDDVLAEYEV